jgi:hypothetical protein
MPGNAGGLVVLAGVEMVLGLLGQFRGATGLRSASMGGAEAWLATGVNGACSAFGSRRGLSAAGPSGYRCSAVATSHPVPDWLCADCRYRTGWASLFGRVIARSCTCPGGNDGWDDGWVFYGSGFGLAGVNGQVRVALTQRVWSTYTESSDPRSGSGRQCLRPAAPVSRRRLRPARRTHRVTLHTKCVRAQAGSGAINGER